jgi:Tfp pilus assembly protein PilF
MIQRTNRTFLLLAVAALAGSLQLPAQKGGAPSTASAGIGMGTSTTNTGTRGTTTPNGLPTSNPNPTNNPIEDRPIFLSGKVMFDDGSPTNPNIAIERVCGGNPRLQAHTDSKGRFSFQMGGNNTASEAALADASESGFGTNQRNQSSPFGGSGNSKNGTSSEASLFGCELRASYPGYRSDSVTLAGHRSMDNPDLGTIILHRLANVQGTTISLTSAQAPKSAQKSFNKAVQAEQKGKYDDAEKHLLDATSEYPKYAVAWFMLGQIQQRQNKTEDARKSYVAAVEADHKYVSPYDQLALLAAEQGKWEDTASYSKQAIDLNPVEFPSSFWYNAISNYNLNKLPEASKSAQALLKLDTAHRYPEANRLMAEIALRNNEYAGAASYLHAYLDQQPKAKDAEQLKQQLLKIEEASAQTKK